MSRSARMRRRACAAVAAAVTGLLLVPGDRLHALPDTGLFSLPHADKAAHAALYALLAAAALFYAGLPARHRVRTSVFAVLFALAHGAAVEAIQPRVGRASESWDLAADAAGAILFVLAYRGGVAGWPRIRRRRLPAGARA